MSRETLFGGSRFLFRVLAPFLILFVVVMAALERDWTSRRGGIALMVILCAVLLLLQLYDGIRFHWAGRLLCAVVFAVYVVFFLQEISDGGWSHRTRSEAEGSVIGAFFGLLVIGLPALLYALRGSKG